MKRIRPAPMGRAFRVVKRTAHLTVGVAERPGKVAAVRAPKSTSRAPKAKTAKAAPETTGKADKDQAAD
jgi:large subunit ribosomal protein L22